MQLFFKDTIGVETSHFVFDKDESRHIAGVLRKQIGDSIHITNGKGMLFTARISNITDKKCEVDLIHSEEKKSHRNYQLSLAIAPTKNINRMEWLVEKATEIGIDQIIPIKTKHSERKQIKSERLHKISISALKQSLQFHLPAIHEMTALPQFLSSDFVKKTKQKYIAVCYQTTEEKPNQYLFHLLKPNSDILVLIGPEGGFAKEEIALALENAFKPVSLGTQRLRTETAALLTVTGVNIQLYNIKGDEK